MITHPLLNQSVSVIQDGIIITNRNGDIEYANPVIEHITGYTCDELVGKNIGIFRSDKHSMEFYESMWKRILAGDIWSGLVINKKKDGSLYNEYMTIYPLRDSSQSITHFVSSKKALDDDAVQQIAMEKLRQRSEHASKAGYEILKDISHQVRTTLNSILGFAELLVDEIPEERREYLSVILSNGNHMLSVMSDLMQIVQIEVGELSMKEEKFLLDNEIRSLVTKLQENSEIAGTTILTLLKDQTCNVHLDRQWFARLLNEVLIHAIQHSRHTQITIATEIEQDNFVRIIIGHSDAWKKNSLRKDIVAELSYLDPNDTHALEESGLNAIFCQRLVDLMHGSIIVYDSYDVGNIFVLQFPMKK